MRIAKSGGGASTPTVAAKPFTIRHNATAGAGTKAGRAKAVLDFFRTQYGGLGYINNIVGEIGFTLPTGGGIFPAAVLAAGAEDLVIKHNATPTGVQVYVKPSNEGFSFCADLGAGNSGKIVQGSTGSEILIENDPNAASHMELLLDADGPIIKVTYEGAIGASKPKIFALAINKKKMLVDVQAAGTTDKVFIDLALGVAARLNANNTISGVDINVPFTDLASGNFYDAYFIDLYVDETRDVGSRIIFTDAFVTDDVYIKSLGYNEFMRCQYVSSIPGSAVALYVDPQGTFGQALEAILAGAANITENTATDFRPFQNVTSA